MQKFLILLFLILLSTFYKAYSYSGIGIAGSYDIKAGSNIIPNGTFEEDATGWEADENSQISWVETGKLRFEHIYEGKLFPMVDWAPYIGKTVRVRASLDFAYNPGKGSAGIQYFDGAWKSVGNQTQNHEFDFTFKVGNTENPLIFRTVSKGTMVYWDDVFVEVVETVSGGKNNSKNTNNTQVNIANTSSSTPFVQRVSGSPCVNRVVTFAVMNTNGATVSGWEISGNPRIDGSTSQSISVIWSASGNYRVRARLSNWQEPFMDISISVISNPKITITPTTSASICPTQSVSFSATLENTGANATIHWYVNTTFFQSGTSRTVTIPANRFNQGSNTVRATVTPSIECYNTNDPNLNSNNISVTLSPLKSIGITIAGDLTVCETGDLNLSANTNPNDSYNYRWFKNGTQIFSDYPNTPSRALSLKPSSFNSNDQFYVEVSKTCYQTTNSAPVRVTKTSRRSFTIGLNVPTGVTYCIGREATFEVAVDENLFKGLKYEWFSNSSLIPGQSGKQLKITTSEINNSQYLKSINVRVTTTTTCLISSTASANASSYPFEVINPPTLPVVQQPFVIEHNTSTNLIASGAGNNEIYRWYESSSDANFLTSSVTPVLTQNKTYHVSKYNVVTRCESGRRPFVITVNKRPIVNAGPDQFLNAPVHQISLDGHAEDPDGIIDRVKWTQVSGPNIVFQDDSKLKTNILYPPSGTYVFQLTAWDNHNYSGSDQVKITINIPSNNYNWIKETTVLVKGVKTLEAAENLKIQNGAKGINWNYYDGLGRPMQSIGVQASPDTNDIVQPIVYDQFGRENKKFLPFTASNVRDGWYKENIINANHDAYTGIAATFYAPGTQNKITGDTRPYAETIFEPSPLNRPHKDFGPGQSWYSQDKFVEHQYLTNVHGAGNGQERIIAWTINAQGVPVRHKTAALNNNTGYYGTSALYVKSTKDEHGKETREYTNKQGQVILKKVQLSDGTPTLDNRTHWLQTYYIYDDFGNLRFVLQPELVLKVMGDANNNLNPDAADLNNFAFIYKYDARQRMIEKKVPGSDWVYMVYDYWDRLVLTQDGNQRNVAGNDKEWTFTKYDALNRPVATGKWVSDKSFSEITGVAGNPGNVRFETRQNSAVGYTLTRSFPTDASAGNLYTVTYYDDYAFINYANWGTGNNDYGFEEELGISGDQKNTRVKGLVTGSKVKVSNSSH